MIDIIISTVVGIIINTIIDYILFRIWHKYAHSKEFKQKEKEKKNREREDLADRKIKDSKDIVYLKRDKLE